MNSPRHSAVFLERKSYRKRRLIDAARFLPILGMVLLSLPLLWRAQEPQTSLNADALIYVFSVWVVLIVLSAVISAGIGGDEASGSADPQD